VPGKLEAIATADGKYIWKWTSPTGTPHLGVERYDTERKATTAGRAWVRKNMARNTVAGDADE